jgi:hypothetical protein
VEQHGVIDHERHRVGRADPAQRIAARLDHRGRLEGGAHATGAEIRLAAEGSPDLLEEPRLAQDVFGVDVDRDRSV